MLIEIPNLDSFVASSNEPARIENPQSRLIIKQVSSATNVETQSIIIHGTQVKMIKVFVSALNITPSEKHDL